MKRFLKGTICLGAVLAMAGANAAGPAPVMDRNGQERSRTVRIFDLDLGSTAGVETLYLRLRTAANRVCRAAELRDLRAVAQARRCREAALDAAVAKVDHPRLTARHSRPESTGEMVGFNLPPAQ